MERNDGGRTDGRQAVTIEYLVPLKTNKQFNNSLKYESYSSYLHLFKVYSKSEKGVKF